MNDDENYHEDIKYMGFWLLAIGIIVWIIGYIQMPDSGSDLTTKTLFKPAYVAIVGGTLFFSGVFLMGISEIVTIMSQNNPIENTEDKPIESKTEPTEEEIQEMEEIEKELKEMDDL